MAFTPAMINTLADMLTPNDEDSDSDEDKPSTHTAKMNPGSIGPAQSTKTSNAKEESKVNQNPKDIWTEEEVAEGAEFESNYDPRPQPEYDIVFKQAVSSEDMFLQMGNKTPASFSCEDMVVKVKLPETKIADVTLDVKSKFLDCRTPKFYLGLHLPNPVDHKNGKAEWDSKTETLSVNLRMKREYDFMNF